jgi:bifunctional DNA-binding transcriptional regulator/antitoxin component of YhaV-PrlF toxin-antitoxin module
MFEVKVKVGKKGQILISKIFRERYSVEEGDRP